MKRFVIRASEYYDECEKISQIIPRLIEATQAHTTLLDVEIIKDYCQNENLSNSDNACEIIFFKVTQAIAARNASFIPKMIPSLPKEKPLSFILDVTSVNEELAYAVLDRMQYDISIVSNNICSVCIVCNDNEIMDYCRKLNETFCVSALNYSPQQINDIYKHMHNYAVYFRYIKHNFLLELLLKIYRKTKKIFKK